MSHLPSSKDTKSTHSANSRDTSSALLEGLHGHYAYATVVGIQIYRSRSLFDSLLAGMGNVTKGKRSFARKMDIARHHLSLGATSRNCYGQRASVPTSVEMAGKTLSHQTYQDFRLQLEGKRTCRAITLRSQGSEIGRA